MQNQILSLPLEKLKRDAKRLGRVNGRAHHLNLEEVAQAAGFASFHEASQTLTAPNSMGVANDGNSIGFRLGHILLPNYRGVRLWDRYGPLNELYEAIASITPDEDGEGTDQVLLAMAYDVRKAFSGQRIKKKLPPEQRGDTRDWTEDYLYGVDIDWVTFIVYVDAFVHFAEEADLYREYLPYFKALAKIRNDGLDTLYPEMKSEIFRIKADIDFSDESLINMLGDASEAFIAMRQKGRSTKLAKVLEEYFLYSGYH